MTTYYLFAYGTEYPTNARILPADIKRVECRSRKEADELAEAYERDLNGGAAWSIEEVAQARHEKRPCTLRRVTAVPFSQAREYNDFQRWPCNQEAEA